MKIPTVFRASLIFIALATLTLPTVGAETKPGPTPATIEAAKPKPAADLPLFRAGEVQIDGIFQAKSLFSDKHLFGGGLGVNYFPWRAAGFGFEARSFDWDHSAVDRVGLSLIGRMPVETLRIAPEIRVGFDADIEKWAEDGETMENRRRNGFDVYASIGAEVRITRNLGIGAEVRGVRPVEGAAGEHLLAIGRVRLTF